MATVNAVITRAPEVPSHDILVVVWEALGGADTGSTVHLAAASDRSIQISGTWGSATAKCQGSNDGVTWFSLTDPQGAAIELTADGLAQIVEVTRYLRVVTTGGTGTDLDATVVAKGIVS